MKKALVLLLVLAVAGGAFAQTFSWSGMVDGQLGMLNRGADDDAGFGVIAPNAGANGVRMDLTFNAANADGNAGVRAMFRANALTGGQDLGALWIRQAFGWVKLWDDLVEVRGGRITEEPHLANRDGLLNGNFTAAGSIGGQTGVIAYLFPIDGLVIGAGGWSASGLGSSWFEGERPASSWENDGLIAYGGFAYTMANVFRLNASIWMSENIGEAHAGFQLLVIPGIPINTGFSFYNLDDFGDSGKLQAMGTVGLNNLVDNLQLGVGAMFGMSQEDDTDAAFAAGVWAAFPFGNIVPRLDLWLFSGLNYNYGACQNTWALIAQNRMTFNSDQMFLHIRPTVQFRATSAAWFELGGLFNIELGDVGAAGGTKDDPLSFGFFTGVRVAF
jgi:hypothetical protein